MVPQLKRKERRQAVIPLTPLIDIVFLLLIYFLLTTNFLTEEGIHIKLPSAKASAPQVDEITVSVDRDGKIWFQDREIAIDNLYGILQQKIIPSGDQLVIIKADREVILNAAVQVMDIAKTAGAARLALATERDN